MSKKITSTPKPRDLGARNLTDQQRVVKVKTTSSKKSRLRLLKTTGQHANLSERFSTALVLYDGLCALCSRMVQFLLENDRHQILKFASLQGDTAKAIFQRHPQIDDNLRSVIYIRDFDSPDETLFFRSGAIIQILDDIDTHPGTAFFLSLVPRFIRDFVYDIIATYRYRWFGKYERCWLPQIKWTERFLP